MTSGTIAFDGVDLVGLDARGWRGLRSTRIGAVFQDPASYLNPSLPVGRQLGEVLRVKGGLSRREARARVLELFAAVGLRRPDVVRRQIPSQLSGGMQQRVMIAIAIACDPDLLIADEPTSALDVKTQAEIVALLQALRERFGLSLLFVSHDLAVVERAVRPRRGLPRRRDRRDPTEPGRSCRRCRAAVLSCWRSSGLRVRFGAHEVLRGVDLAVAPGEIVGLIGETGSGKTTLARSVVGLVQPSAGSRALRADGPDGAGRRAPAARVPAHRARSSSSSRTRCARSTRRCASSTR